MAGLGHDLGKYDSRFQAYLAGRGTSVDHSNAGGALLLDMAGSFAERIAAEALAYCILGHHTGLPDRRKDGAASLDARHERFENQLDPAWRADVRLDLDGISEELRGHVSPDTKDFDLSVAIRMLFSCLVEADSTDTEAFYVSLGARYADRRWPTLGERLPKFRARFATCIRRASTAPVT